MTENKGGSIGHFPMKNNWACLRIFRNPFQTDEQVSAESNFELNINSVNRKQGKLKMAQTQKNPL